MLESSVEAALRVLQVDAGQLEAVHELLTHSIADTLPVRRLLAKESPWER